MTPTLAWLLAAGLVASAGFALAGPPAGAAALLVVGIAAARAPRRGLLWFVASSMAINTIIVAAAQPTGHVVAVLGWSFGSDGARLGATAGLRLAALVAINMGALQRVGVERFVEGLRLPRAPTGRLAAVLLASRDLADDGRRLVVARRADGSWPSRRGARLAALGGLVPVFVACALRRARVRQDALQLAGIQTSPDFVPVLAVTALAMAGRMPFVALPNVALTYVAVFAGGLVFGWRVGAVSGAAAMAGTNLLVTGLDPVPFANVPAMALVGAAGALFRPLGRRDRGPAAFIATRVLAAVAGIGCALVFSIASDVGTWALMPEYGWSLDLLWPLLHAGLAFNVLPAAVNGVLFAAAIEPLARGMRHLEGSSTPGGTVPVPHGEA